MKLIPVYCFFLLFACKPNQQTTPNFVDSLLAGYTFRDSVFILDDEAETSLFTTTVNGKPYALYFLKDCLLIIYDQQQSKWVAVDTVAIDDYALGFHSADDLNGDGTNDVVIYSHYNMHGQTRCSVLLTDSNNNLHYRPDIHLWNIHFDTVKHQLTSYYEGGAFSDHSKEIYNWKNDSLVLMRGIVINLSQHPKLGRFYTLKDTIKITGDVETVFDTAFFSDYPGHNVTVHN